MKIKQYCSLVLLSTSIFFGVISNAQGDNIISVKAINSPINVGQQISFELWMDFSTPTIGGGVDVLFNNFSNANQLSYVSYTPVVFGDPALISVPAINASNNSLDTITFGDFTSGVSGNQLIGTLLFDTQVAGNYSLSLTDSTQAGGFYDLSSNIINTTYVSADFTVAPTITVPEPAAIWLMISGLSGLAFRARTKKV